MTQAQSSTINVFNTVNNMLENYRPDTLARELLQNADDAGAKTLIIQHLPGDNTRNDWQGPLVFIWNDGPLEEGRDGMDSDFDRLSQVTVSGKTGHPYRIGRFGVGKVALFSVSKAHWIRAKGKEPVILAHCKEDDERRRWNTADEGPHPFEDRLPVNDEANFQDGLTIVFPPEPESKWAETWLGYDSALPHWRAMAQVLPLMRSLTKLRIKGLDWEATWAIEERPDKMKENLRRNEHLLGPSWDPRPNPPKWWMHDQFKEGKPSESFRGVLSEIVRRKTEGAAPSEKKIQFIGQEIRLNFQGEFGSHQINSKDVPIVPHAAVLCLAPDSNSSPSIDPFLREVVFIGLGNQFESATDHFGMIFHANGEMDSGRTILEHLDKGMSYEGQFNRRLLRDGLLPP